MDARSVTTESVILRGKDYLEADRILIIFTREFGKMSVLAKGVRKPSSKIKASTQMFSYSKLSLSRSKSLPLVLQGETINSLTGLREDLIKIAAASYIGEMIDIATYEQKPNDQMFILAVTALTLLESCDDPYLILRFFDLKLMAILGYRPYLEKCMICDRTHKYGKFVLAPERGGIVCESCYQGDLGVGLSIGAILTMEKILDWDLRHLFNLKISPQIRSEIDQGLAAYMDYYLVRSSKARASLAEYLL